jgi:hypothetical protein
VVFSKGTNDYNRFTLFEAIAAHYGFVTAGLSAWEGHETLAFPDLNSVTIRHPAEDGSGWTTNRVSLNYLLGQNPSSRGPLGDRQLQWGDVVDILEVDHPINATWEGLPEDTVAGLKHFLDRQVRLTVKGQTTNLLLSLPTTAPHGPSGGRRLDSSTGTVPSFALLPVLKGSGLLRSSSDLSRVRVRRHDQATGQTYELVFDCSSSSGPGPNLWLRNGDEIEVPEKQ